MRASRSLLVTCLVVVIILTATTSSAKTRHLAIGTWGGEHIRVTIGRSSASVEYDCANGSITAPLNLDRKGKFSWQGFYTQERGGPVRQDQQPNNQPALYSGWVNGNRMTLRVRLANTNETIGTYQLKKGSSGSLVKCL